MSLPSITQQTDQMVVEEPTDRPNLDVPQGLTPVAEEKPSPMLGTPLPPQQFNEPNEEVNDRDENEAPPVVSVQEATPKHSVRRSSSERQISRNVSQVYKQKLI